MIVENVWQKLWCVTAYLLSLITIDKAVMASLTKGFILGTLVIFGMCYLDWQQKLRLHATDMKNKVSAPNAHNVAGQSHPSDK